MAQSIKLGSDTYLDASGVVFNKTQLNGFLAGICTKSATTVSGITGTGNAQVFNISLTDIPSTQTPTRLGIVVFAFHQSNTPSMGMVLITYDSNRKISSISAKAIYGTFDATLDTANQTITVVGATAMWANFTILYDPRLLIIS